MIVHMIAGNVGSGKTTLANKILKNSPGTFYLSDDALCLILNRVYSEDFWTDRHKKAYKEMMHYILERAIYNDFNVVLDSAFFMSENYRSEFLNICRIANVETRFYDVHCEEALVRRLKENRNSGETDWTEVYNRMEKTYVKPSYKEYLFVIYSINGADGSMKLESR